ncbi:MAG: hypothetical protein LLG06_01675, partial [Desulfobacteraceae bacterium]|nr:hypothetical protein [Desulfobacteraceae bacterium]
IEALVAPGLNRLKLELMGKSGDSDFSRLQRARRKRRNEQRSCVWGVGSKLPTLFKSVLY